MADISKIKRTLVKIEDLCPAGFAIAFHIRMTSADFQFQNYPTEWSDIYSERGYVMVDPIVRWGFCEIGAIRWTELKKTDEENVLDQAVEFGMVYGAAIATETNGSRSVAGFSRPDREFTDAEIEELVGYVDILHALTTSDEGMSAQLRTELTELSIKMNHRRAEF